jgi:hypothetical protein
MSQSIDIFYCKMPVGWNGSSDIFPSRREGGMLHVMDDLRKNKENKIHAQRQAETTTGNLDGEMLA